MTDLDLAQDFPVHRATTISERSYSIKPRLFVCCLHGKNFGKFLKKVR